MVEGRRESMMTEMYLQGNILISSELLLRSAFGTLVQVYLKAPNHLSF